MPLDPRIQAGLAMLPPKVPSTASPAERRAQLRALAPPPGSRAAAPDLVATEFDATAPGPAGDVAVRVYRPRQGTLPAYIYLHGGGWWLGDLADSDDSCRRRAAGADCVVVSVGYRLAPEHPFPAAVEDCWTAVRWVFAEAATLDIDASRVAIGGGSAGGNLAAVMTLLAREDPWISFVGQLLEVPATDLTLVASQGSAAEFADGYGLSRADLIECVEFYLGEHDPSDPLASPLLADLHDLPPALVTTAECDPVRDDGEAYAAKLQSAGVPVTLRRWAGQVHGSMEMDVVVPDVAAAYREEAHGFLRRVFGTAG